MATRIAFGFSVHTGWAQVAAVAGPLTAPAVLQRARIEFAPAPESVEVFHVAAELPPDDASAHVERCRKIACGRALDALKALIANFADARRSAVGVVVGNAVLPPLRKILGSHMLIHAAEGDFYRQAILRAAGDLDVVAVAVPSKELHNMASRALKLESQALPQWLSDVGRKVGRPWDSDVKNGVLAACIALSARSL